VAIRDWAFIALGNGGESAEGERVEVDLDGLRSRFVVVPDAAAAASVAVELAGAGIQTLELCGAFTAADVAAIRDATAGRLPVGCVLYGADSVAAFAALLED
jgi:hypothetical protein